MLGIKRLSSPRAKGKRKLRARPSTELVSKPSSKIRLNSQRRCAMPKSESLLGKNKALTPGMEIPEVIDL